jgi:UDP:flavonoid glycosyltransferase YjiC (YdhE family)
MTKPVLLFAPETLNIAETTRMIEVAKACREDFEPHFCGYGGDFVRLIEESGFPFHPLEPAYTPEKIQHLYKIDRMETWGAPFTVEEIEQRVQSECRLYQQLSPAAVVIGFTMTVYLSARVARLPLVVVAPFAFSRAFFEAGLGTFPDQFRRSVLRLIPKRLLDTGVNWLGLHTRMWTKNFNIVMEKHGLPPFESVVRMWEGDYTLVTDIPKLTGVDSLPENWHYVGPIFAHLDGNIPAEVSAMQHKRPLIYCAMGSSGNRDVVKQVIESFHDTPYQVIAPVKMHMDERVNVPSNILICDWLPAHKVNPLADVAVIHGGQGTVQTACASGTPFVGIGMQPEQEWNIDFVARKGCAIRIGRHDVTRKRLLDAVETLLHDESAHRKAKALQQAFTQWDGAREVAGFLKRLVDKRAAIPRSG